MPLTDRQAEIVAALRARQAGQLADMFEAAVRLLDQDDMPCRTNLVAHAAREVSNSLPRHLDLPIPDRVEYFEAFKVISRDWANIVRLAEPGHPADDERSLPPPRVDPIIEIGMPPRLVEKLDTLVDQHVRSREWNRRRRLGLAVRKLDAARRDEAVDDAAPGPHAALVDRWHALNRWFQSAVHLRRDGEATPSIEECQRRFAELEDVLFALLAPHFAVSDEINDLLEDANS